MRARDENAKLRIPTFLEFENAGLNDSVDKKLRHMWRSLGNFRVVFRESPRTLGVGGVRYGTYRCGTGRYRYATYVGESVSTYGTVRYIPVRSLPVFCVGDRSIAYRLPYVLPVLCSIRERATQTNAMHSYYCSLRTYGYTVLEPSGPASREQLKAVVRKMKNPDRSAIKSGNSIFHNPEQLDLPLFSRLELASAN